MSSEDIQKKLKEATYHCGTGEAFIPYESVQEVWAGDRLEQFLETQDPSLDTSEIAEARRGLLRMISILTGVVPRDWSGWSRFRQIFFPPDNIGRDRRRDKNVITFTEEELKDDSFLGDTNLAAHFVGHMWIYFPIVFNGNGQDPYEKNLRLPLFQEPGNLVCRVGGYGAVTREVIPPKHIILSHVSDHLGIPNSLYPDKLIVARKRFLPQASFDLEVRHLKLLRSSLSSHNRIVSHLAIFTAGNELNIIMPWADMDLEHFLAGGYKEIQSTPSLLDLIQESKKVASAIQFLHENLQLEIEWEELRHLAICHADLKPENIVVFKREGSSTGVWRITDFGVSRLANRALSGTSRHDSGYSPSFSARPPRGGTYKAPDAQAQRRSDVWSFGCILVRVFALGLDPASLPELDKNRKESLDGLALDDCFYRGEPPALNPGVKTWIEGLSTQYRASFNLSFFEKMQNLLRSMLEIDYRHRPSAREVRRDLHALHSPFATSGSDTPPPPPIKPGIPHPPRPAKEVSVLVTVMKSGDINQVRQILQDEVDVEQCYENERPLIHAIKMTNAAAIIQELSKYQRGFHSRNLDVRTPSSGNQTPLYLAVCEGNVDTVRAVINADVDPDIDLDSNANINTLLNELCEGKTPLMQAAFLGNAGVVSLLLERGADHKICVQEEKLNCLHYAVKSGNRAQADVIRAFKDKMDFDQLPPNTTLESEGNPSKAIRYETPMMLHINLAPAGLYNYLGPDSLWGEKFNALLEGKADINRKYNPGTPLEKNSLQFAVEEKKFSLVQVLVSAGATLPAGYNIPRGIPPDIRRPLKKAWERLPAGGS